MGGVDVGAVDLHIALGEHAHLGAQLFQNLQQRGNVADLGNILNAADALHQQGGGDNGNSGILGAADIDFTVQRSPAVNHILFQGCTSFIVLSPIGANRCIESSANPWAKR